MKPPQQMTRAELLEEVRQLRESGVEQTLRRTILELQVYREEVRQQNEELIAAQKQLEWSRDRYAELFDAAPVGYVTLDPHGVVEEINLTGARLIGHEVPNVVGRPFLFAVADADAFLAHLARCRAGEKLVVSELELRPRSGANVPVEMRSRASGRDGRVLFMTTLSDLSEWRRLEAERQRLELEARVAQEANEAKDRFLAVLSHELRNPLAAIAAGASVLSEASLPSALAETVERIRRNAFAEARLVTDLLDASRLRHGKLRIEREAIDLHGLIEDTLAGLRGEVARVELRLEAQQHVVSGDPMRLGQVLSNLLRNAQSATAGGGEIRVLTTNPSPGQVLLSVVDGGRGIPARDLARIFSPFESAKPSDGSAGLGLGLPISKGLVEAHGGRLEAASEGPGKGARFDVELPVLASAKRKPERRPAPAAPRAAPLRILLVEDHQDTAESLALLLEQRGFQVAIANSIAAALARAAEGFDVLISDLGLPDGSGHDLVQSLAERGPLRAIALSGYGSAADVRESQQAGFHAHLVKPIEPAALLRVLERIAAA